jgi:hypothetical protein
MLTVSFSDFHVAALQETSSTIFCMHSLMLPTEIHMQPIVTSLITLP